MALKVFYKEGVSEAGCDEAGRGCLAGPVYAGAVILPSDYTDPLLNDSKQLSRKERDILRKRIETESIAWAVAAVSPEEIDEINILNASYLAMHRALDRLDPRPTHILVDGNRFKPYRDIPGKCIIKGDGKFYSIAAASVLAKVYRDEFMGKIHNEHPQYNWLKNKGYPTREHREGIKKYGACDWHRKSFKLLDEQLKIEF
jgi:ribonuclease HII